MGGQVSAGSEVFQVARHHRALPQWVWVAAAGVLLFAALGKTALLVRDPFADVRLRLRLGLVCVIIFLEGCLGYCNVRYAWRFWRERSASGQNVTQNVHGMAQRTAHDVPGYAVLWASNLGLFALFALVGLWRWLTGESHCACFGWQMPIGWMVFLDISMVMVLLMFGRPRLFWSNRDQPTAERLSSGGGRQGSWKAYLRSRADVLGTAVGIGAVLCVIWFWQRGGLSAVGSELGKDVGIYGRAELSALSVARPTQGVIRLRNVGHQASQIVAVRSSCRCVVVTPPSPWWIEARGESSVAVQVRATRRGPFHERVLFYVAGPSGRPVAVDVVGWVW